MRRGESDDVKAGMRILDGEYGLPPLPDIDFALVWSNGGKNPATTAFGELICEMA